MKNRRPSAILPVPFGLDDARRFDDGFAKIKYRWTENKISIQSSKADSIATECFGYDKTVEALMSLPPPEGEGEVIVLTLKRLQRKPKVTISSLSKRTRRYHWTLCRWKFATSNVGTRRQTQRRSESTIWQWWHWQLRCRWHLCDMCGWRFEGRRPLESQGTTRRTNFEEESSLENGL